MGPSSLPWSKWSAKFSPHPSFYIPAITNLQFFTVFDKMLFNFLKSNGDKILRNLCQIGIKKDLRHSSGKNSNDIIIHILLCCRAELQRVPNGPSIPSSRVKMCPLIKHGLHKKYFSTRCRLHYMPNKPQLLSGKATKLLFSWSFGNSIRRQNTFKQPDIRFYFRFVWWDEEPSTIYWAMGNRLLVGWNFGEQLRKAERREFLARPRMRECFKKAAKIGPDLRLTFKRFNRERDFEEILKNPSLIAG